MEVLYPDVIGSGGAPKRIMRPRRQTDGGIVDEGGMPGTGVISLQTPQQVVVDGTNSSRAILSQTPSSSNGSIPPQPQTTGPVTSLASRASALTPPEDNLTQSQGRKRRHQAPATTSATTMLTAQSLVDSALSPPVTSAALPTHAAGSPPKRRRTSQNPTAFSLMASSATNPPTQTQTQTQVTGEPMTVAALLQLPFLEEALESLKARAAPPRWREQALDIFFQEFSTEELDLQVKISENVLSNNENKAMVFCKMPPLVRQHWVGKFREMHQLNKSS